MRSRAELTLDAAIDVLGARGARHLTHRAVDAAAGLPLGSTSNRFRTRQSLLLGVLGRILEREAARWWRSAEGLQASTVAGFSAFVGQVLRELVDEDRVLSQARRAVFVEAAADPVLRDQITAAQREISAWLSPALAGLGFDRPEPVIRHLLALMDGLIGHQLATPDADFAPAVAVEALLRGLGAR